LLQPTWVEWFTSVVYNHDNNNNNNDNFTRKAGDDDDVLVALKMMQKASRCVNGRRDIFQLCDAKNTTIQVERRQESQGSQGSQGHLASLASSRLASVEQGSYFYKNERLREYGRSSRPR
jgi:hypothetical protein